MNRSIDAHVIDSMLKLVPSGYIDVIKGEQLH